MDQLYALLGNHLGRQILRRIIGQVMVLVQREELPAPAQRRHVVRIKCPARTFRQHRTYVVGKPQ